MEDAQIEAVKNNRFTLLDTPEYMAKFEAYCTAKKITRTSVLRPHLRAFVDQCDAEQNQPVPPT